MGDKHEQPQSVPASSSQAGAPSSTAEDTTVAADPFASTLTVSPAPAPNGPRLEPGRELGPVRLVREIGRGATGAVFHGHHRVLGRDVAVKFLINVTAGSGDADGVKRFVDEARAAASVRHPNLTQIFHADLDGTTPYLVLEYVQGPTLRQLLDYAGGLSVPVTTAVLADVAAAVAELHARGLIHRDIKPSNVLVDKDGRVLVTDFGLALRRSHAAGHGAAAEQVEFAGTPAYMAGEMFEGRVSPRSDVYAMGVMAFQLLTGTTPFAGTFHEVRDKHLHEPLPSALLCERGVEPAVVEVVERATSKQAIFRYKTAPDFARALREAAGCKMPEMARARKHLCDLVIARGAGASAEGPATHSRATGVVRGPLLVMADDDAGSSLYTETISRIATLKRERRRYPPGDADGSSSTGSPASSSDVSSVRPPAGRLDSIQPHEADAAFAPARQADAQPIAIVDDTASNAAPTATRAGREPVPGPVLLVSVLAILYGVLVLVWQVEVLLGAKNMSPQLPPVTEGAVPLYFALVPAAIVHALIVGLFVLAGVGCLKLRSWGRRMMIGLGAADLLFQVAVLLVALAWIEPVTVSVLLSRENGAGTLERAVLEKSIAKEWIALWFALSLFPAFAVGVMTRRRVRDAFTSAARRPDPEDKESEPFF